jgi:hypothetical protein
MALNIGQLVDAVVTAVKPILGKAWDDVESYVKTEAAKLALTLAHIEELNATGKISPAEATALVNMQKNAMQAVLLTAEGIGLVAAQSAINAAIGAIRTVVNKALGWTLL